MRKQPTRVRTGAAGRYMAIATAVLFAVLLTAAMILLYTYEPPYQPPPLEKNAVSGIPEPAPNMSYGEIDAAGKFTIGIAGTMYRQEDGSVNLFFTNFEQNNAYLMCEVVDIEQGKTIYKSGLLRPGEYVESLYPLRKMKDEAIPVEIFVYALALEDYLSLGQISLDNILQPN